MRRDGWFTSHKYSKKKKGGHRRVPRVLRREKWFSICSDEEFQNQNLSRVDNSYFIFNAWNIRKRHWLLVYQGVNRNDLST